MTKKIRIENADNSSHNVAVDEMDWNEETGEMKATKTHYLSVPTTMVELTIWKGKILRVREVE